MPTLMIFHAAGLEPATCRLEGGCSIQLSYGVSSAWVLHGGLSLRIRLGNVAAAYQVRRLYGLMRPGHDSVEAEIV